MIGASSVAFRGESASPILYVSRVAALRPGILAIEARVVYAPGPRGHQSRSIEFCQGKARTLNAPGPKRERKGPAPSESPPSTGDRVSVADGLVHQCVSDFSDTPGSSQDCSIHFQSRLPPHRHLIETRVRIRVSAAARDGDVG